MEEYIKYIDIWTIILLSYIVYGLLHLTYMVYLVLYSMWFKIYYKLYPDKRIKWIAFEDW